jgi:outer membrane protein
MNNIPSKFYSSFIGSTLFTLFAYFLVINSGAASQAASIEKMDLRTFVHKIYQNNDKVLKQHFEKLIAKEAVNNAEGIFEPEFNLTASRTGENKKNTNEEQLSRSLRNLYHNHTNSVDIGVEQLLPIGTKVSLTYSLQDITNTLQSASAYGNEFTTSIGISASQPLLRNFGVDATKISIDIAKTDIERQKELYHKIMNDITTQAVVAYFEIQQSQELVTIRQKSLKTAKSLVKDVQRRMQAGVASRTELLTAEIGLTMRVERFQDAIQKQRATVNNANKLMLRTSNLKNTHNIQATGPLPPVDESLTPDIPSLEIILAQHPEYQSSQKQITREQLRLDYAKNQALPEWNINVDISKNGMNGGIKSSWYSAMQDDLHTWSVSSELKIPIWGNQTARSEIQAITIRKKQMERSRSETFHPLMRLTD